MIDKEITLLFNNVLSMTNLVPGVVYKWMQCKYQKLFDQLKLICHELKFQIRTYVQFQKKDFILINTNKYFIQMFINHLKIDVNTDNYVIEIR